MQSEAIAKLAMDIAKQKETIVFNKLRELGYTFENENDKITFVAMRIERHVYPEYEEIVLDKNTSIARWVSQPEITQGYNENGEFKLTGSFNLLVP